jgi:hypothetical protein
VAASRLHRGGVVQRNEVGVHAGMVPVHQHRRLAVQRLGIDQPLATPERVEDEAVDLVAGQRIGLGLAVDVVAGLSGSRGSRHPGGFSAPQHGHRIGIVMSATIGPIKRVPPPTCAIGLGV